ncbi:Uncharacterised protein [Burkholderia pseudomallei]|nr:Uncharacterised protein [Burkholderia pseudomallei]
MHLKSNSRFRVDSNNGRFWPRRRENAKLLGFRVSLQPSRANAQPTRRDLNGQLFRLERSACIFTRPRPHSAVRCQPKAATLRLPGATTLLKERRALTQRPIPRRSVCKWLPIGHYIVGAHVLEAVALTMRRPSTQRRILLRTTLRESVRGICTTHGHMGIAFCQFLLTQSTHLPGGYSSCVRGPLKRSRTRSDLIAVNRRILRRALYALWGELVQQVDGITAQPVTRLHRSCGRSYRGAMLQRHPSENNRA